ncbi:hypothetical protein ABZS76_32925 [Streptomyces sp. NPDC005562]|uniref:hypothetical protein n=1 Tax=Streptomyces sp. NPDC005562 TaxID=3154890 RepID=UPI00339F83B9
MSEPDETTVMHWNEHNDHAATSAREEALVYGGEQDPPEDGYVYVYHPETPRTVLGASMYEQVRLAVKETVANCGTELSESALEAAAHAAVAALGFLPPVPEPFRRDTCEALWPNSQGVWLQCGMPPKHGGEQHREGEEEWADTSANAVPAPVYSNEPPF